MARTPDQLEIRGAQEVAESPRSGVKIAVSRSRVGTDVFIAKNSIPSWWVKKGDFYVDNVYVEDVNSILPRFDPVFSVMRNIWEVSERDDRKKQTAVDFVQYADLSVLSKTIRGPIETFRAERERGVNYSLRSFNIDRARVEGEQIEGYPISDLTYFILTSDYRMALRQR